MRLALVFLLALLLAPGAGRWGSSVAQAASLRFTVITTADAPDAPPGDGLCADADRQCTLRAVVQETDAQPAGSSVAVSVPAGTYLLTLGTLTLSRNSVRLLGAGASLTLLTGQGSRVLTVDAEARLALSGVTLTGGTAPVGQPGGALANQGVTVLTNRSVLSNTAPISGGGIRNVGANVALMVSLVAVTVASNSTGLETLAPATTALTDTIIADSASGPNCSGPLAESAGYNLESSSTCGFSQPTDLTNHQPAARSFAEQRRSHSNHSPAPR